jgi:CheY-like chemotaxis protein
MVQTLHNRYGLIRQSTNLIMLIEDDMEDTELIIRASNELAIRNQIIHFHDGQSALDYLFHRSEFGDVTSAPHPKLILLDMNLPGMDGIEILRTIKASDELRMIPVVILTTSAAEQDIRRAYCHHANSYVIKPVGCEEFKELMAILCSYWLRSNKVAKIQDAPSESRAF